MTSHSNNLTSDPSDTPKTDAAALQAQFFPFSAEVVPVRFARAQERRIAELKNALRYALKYEGGDAACVRHWRFVARDVLEIEPCDAPEADEHPHDRGCCICGKQRCRGHKP